MTLAVLNPIFTDSFICKVRWEFTELVHHSQKSVCLLSISSTCHVQYRWIHSHLWFFLGTFFQTHTSPCSESLLLIIFCSRLTRIMLLLSFDVDQDIILKAVKSLQDLCLTCDTEMFQCRGYANNMWLKQYLWWILSKKNWLSAQRNFPDSWICIKFWKQLCSIQVGLSLFHRWHSLMTFSFNFVTTPVW